MRMELKQSNHDIYVGKLRKSFIYVYTQFPLICIKIKINPSSSLLNIVHTNIYIR